MRGPSSSETKALQYLPLMKQYLFDRLADGLFRLKITKTFPFRRVVEAYQYLESNQQVGKVVISL